MRMMNALENVAFREQTANAEPLVVDEHTRIIRFALQPGQTIKGHNAPASPFYVVVLQGRGVFTDGDDVEHEVGPNALLAFDVGENHSVRAQDEPFVFLGFLRAVPSVPEGKKGGVLGRR